ncbi:MAG: hypothetical protein VW239_01515 [Candidatus Nanopelagicales bacterium]
MIRTQYRGPTSTKGAAIIATAFPGGSFTQIPYPYGLNVFEAHASAAIKLAKRLGLEGQLVVAPTKTGYVFVPAANPTVEIPK